MCNPRTATTRNVVEPNCLRLPTGVQAALSNPSVHGPPADAHHGTVDPGVRRHLCKNEFESLVPSSALALWCKVHAASSCHGHTPFPVHRSFGRRIETQKSVHSQGVRRPRQDQTLIRRPPAETQKFGPEAQHRVEMPVCALTHASPILGTMPTDLHQVFAAMHHAAGQTVAAMLGNWSTLRSWEICTLHSSPRR